MWESITPIGGDIRFEGNRFAQRDRQYFLDEIVMLMAGCAAEKIMVG